jgi:hypothetical protein
MAEMADLVESVKSARYVIQSLRGLLTLPKGYRQDQEPPTSPV